MRVKSYLLGVASAVACGLLGAFLHKLLQETRGYTLAIGFWYTLEQYAGWLWTRTSDGMGESRYAWVTWLGSWTYVHRHAAEHRAYERGRK